MSLTQEDLRAVKQLIDSSIDDRVPRIIDDRVLKIIDERVPKIIDDCVPKIIDSQVPSIIDGRVQIMLDKLEERTFKRLTRLEGRLVARIDELEDVLTMQTENGLQEIRQQLGEVEKRVARTERIRRGTLKRISKTA